METHLWRLIQQWLDAQLFHVSQAQLAAKLGVTRSAVSQWKLGQARPSPEALRGLSELTKIPFDELRHAVMLDLGYTDTEERDGDDHDAAPIEQYGLAARRGTKDNPHAGLGDEGIDEPGEWDDA